MNLRQTSLTVLLVAVVFLALAARRPMVKGSANEGLKDVPGASNTPETPSTPVLVELFTSEGCSSCPPADALLSRIGQTQPVRGADIIALEEHVDYWDRLGWKDPFSSEAATDRQGDYGAAFGGSQVYTPQMIVDGRTEFVGSSDPDALRAIRTASQAPKPAVRLSWEKDDILTVHIEPLNNTAEPISRPDTEPWKRI